MRFWHWWPSSFSWRRQVSFSGLLLASWLAGMLSLPALSVVAATGSSPAADRQRQATALVSEALHSEIYGQHVRREALLREACTQVPNYAPARWQLGQVLLRNEWVAADEIPDRVSRHPALGQYRRLRSTTPDTVEGNLALARFCGEQKLVPQRRAHLARVIELDFNHAPARAELGFSRLSGQWISLDERTAAAARQKAESASLAKWGKLLGEIADQLEAPAVLRRTGGQRRLSEITDDAAIPALFEVLAPRSEVCARQLVAALARFSHPEATAALARLAVFSEWEGVRREAGRCLAERPFHEFVPGMVASLSSPIEVKSELAPGPGGRLVLRQIFARETLHSNEVVDFATAYRRERTPNGNGNETLARALQLIAREGQTRLQELQRQNDTLAQLNSRLGGALAQATGQSAENTVPQWWAWWHAYNEVFVPAEKTTNTQVVASEVALSDRPSISTGGGQRTSGGGRIMDCLAAGTRVWTLEGPLPIEAVRVGDLVLSQSVETGELTYKPVLRTTIRPPAGLVRVALAGESLDTSGGHPFFVAGAGWIKARQLRSGMVLHTPRGGQPVSQVEEIASAATYNLEVADFHNYFAGDARVLCHDNTPRQPTAAAVPGLIAP